MDGVEPRGLLPALLLLLIYERPAHGYDLIHRLVRLGVADPEPGHVYRVLRDLERRRLLRSGWVASDSGPARRRYELTPHGLAELESWMARLEELRGLLGAGLRRWAEASGSAPSAHSLSASTTARPLVPASSPRTRSRREASRIRTT